MNPSALRALVNSDKFNIAVAAVIVANAATLGAGTFPSLADNTLLSNLNTAFYAAFVMELVLRIAAYGKKPLQFLRNGWNVFDLIVIAAGLIPAVSSGAQALRLARLGRIVRLIRFLPDARVLVAGVVKSLPPLGSLVVLTFLLLFVYGMLGWTLFGAALPQHWGTITTSMLTLFVLLTLENFPTYLEEAGAVSVLAVPFFISYALLAAFIIFNLLIGIIIGSLEEARDAAKKQGSAAPAESIAAIREALDALEQSITVSEPTPLRPTRSSDPAPGRVA